MNIERKSHPIPWRYGFTDALFKRECRSPWADKGYQAAKMNQQYLAGYLAGKEGAEPVASHPSHYASAGGWAMPCWNARDDE